MSATTHKKLPTFRTDEEAERFVAEADLAQYDLSGKPMSEVFPELAPQMKRPRGRPKVDDPAIPLTVRVRQTTFDRLVALGKDWRKIVSEALEQLAPKFHSQGSVRSARSKPAKQTRSAPKKGARPSKKADSTASGPMSRRKQP
jgi:hypothetical protein